MRSLFGGEDGLAYPLSLLIGRCETWESYIRLGLNRTRGIDLAADVIERAFLTRAWPMSMPSDQAA